MVEKLILLLSKLVLIIKKCSYFCCFKKELELLDQNETATIKIDVPETVNGSSISEKLEERKEVLGESVAIELCAEEKIEEQKDASRESVATEPCVEENIEEQKEVSRESVTTELCAEEKIEEQKEASRESAATEPYAEEKIEEHKEASRESAATEPYAEEKIEEHKEASRESAVSESLVEKNIEEQKDASRESVASESLVEKKIEEQKDASRESVATEPCAEENIEKQEKALEKSSVTESIISEKIEETKFSKDKELLSSKNSMSNYGQIESCLKKNIYGTTTDESLLIKSEKEKNFIKEQDYYRMDNNEISKRTLNLLSNHGVYTVSQLMSFAKKNDMSKIKNVGKKTLSELNHIIFKYKHGTSNFSQRSTSVEMVFGENRFNIFLDYCRNKGIETTEDLKNIDIQSLHSVSGLGETKIHDISNRCDEVVRSKGLNGGVFKNINEQIRDLDISFLSVFQVKPIQIDKLKDAGFKNIGSLERITMTHLISIVSNRNFDKYRDFSDKLQLSLIELLKNFLSNRINQPEYVISVKRAEGYTLQEIADEWKVTRERVRQIVEKFMSGYLDHFMIPITKRLMIPKGYASTQDILDIFDDDDYSKILFYWCKNSKNIHYLEYADVFLPEEFDISKIESELLGLAEDFIGEGIHLSEQIDDLATILKEKNYFYLDVDSFLNFIRLHGYKTYNDFIVKRAQSKSLFIERIVYEKFPKGIKINDAEDINLLRKYMLEDYGITLSSSNKAINNRIPDRLVLCGRGLYISEKRIYVEQQLLDELKNAIDKKQEAHIYYSNLYAEYKGMICMMSTIDNYHYLHGVLRLYFAHDYDFSNRDFLTKKGDGLVSGKLRDRFKDLILRIGRPVNKKEILQEYPGVTDIVLSNAITNDDCLFQWDVNEYSSLQLVNVSEEEKEYLRTTIQKILNQNKGYCSYVMLYDEVKNCRVEIINNNNIKHAINLFFLCAKLFEIQFDFKRPHICRKGLLLSMSVKSVALHLLDDPVILDYKQYQFLVDQLKWSTVTSNAVFGEIEKDYFRISLELYIKSDSFVISHDKVKLVEECLRKKLSDGFVSLLIMDFDGYPELDLGCRWNAFLLRSVVEKYLPNFKYINITKNRINEKGIIIEKNFCINNYVDLVIWLIKRRGDNKIKESALLSLLVLKGLARNTIPKELYLSDKFLIQNGIFTIREESERDSV